MGMKLQHFSHDHELMLINEVHKDDEEIKSCYGCGKPMLEEESAFRCTYDGCKFGLHKRCAELPKEIKHPMHSDHILTLHAHPPYWSWGCTCNACTLSWNLFTYNCQQCEFDICISCALKEDERVIEHEGHNHPLTLLKSSASLHCDACHTRDEDLSYLCTTCLFWIHKTCAFSPNTIHKTWIHDHPLNLAYSLPYQFRSFTYDCDICGHKVHPSNWVYCCADCRYFTHVKCATTSDHDQKPSIGSGSEIKAEEDAEMLHFPMPESVDLISQLVKVEDAEKPPQLTHFSHPHTLLLYDVQNGNNIDQMRNINDEIIICNGCVRPITTLLPFYGCSRQCNFFLHTTCANLPTQLLLHSYHPHPLQLYKSPDFDYCYQCDRCKISCNGFAFWCRFCKDFYLCIQCSFLPSKIKHDSHSHPLQLQNENALVKCRACTCYISGDNYECEPCRFNLHPYCAINWPSKVTHEWDEHPVALSYPPFNYHPDEFYCEICEEEMHPKFWLYLCRECDQPFHMHCIRGIDVYSNVKFGGTFQIENHPHALTFVRKSKNESPSPCNCCGEQQNDLPVLECAPCNFLRCVECFVKQFGDDTEEGEGADTYGST